MRLGMVTGKDMAFCDGFIFCVNTVSWGLGSPLHPMVPWYWDSKSQ